MFRKLGLVATAVLFFATAAFTLHPKWTSVPLTNFVPFKFVFPLLEPGNAHYELRNVFGNTLLWVPAAVAATLLWKNAKRAVALVAIAATTAEVVQYVAGRRVVDVDDVILACFGAIIAANLTLLLRNRLSPVGD